MKNIILFLTLLYIWTGSIAENIIHTESGRIRGKRISALKNDVYAYLGIPYAVPPVGELRFRPPRPVFKWDEVYNATVMSPVCMQDPINPTLEWIPRHRHYTSEDCLYLNIWVPAYNAEDKPLSTMVFIHGGAFNTGSANMDIYYGKILASIGKVIVVSINYRLGAFGFLSFNHYNVPGNVGMLDQVMALKWIRQNIESFGGDRDEITLFGSSAGAISIGHHLISPLTKGLFKRAIMQSGSSYMPLFSVDKAVNIRTSEVIATNTGCGNSDEICTSNDVMSCLQHVEAEKIANAERVLLEQRSLISIVPQKGEPYLPKDPIQSINEGSIHDVEVMIGKVPNEGSWFLAFHKPELLTRDDPLLTKSEAELLISIFYGMQGPQLERVVERYLGHLQEDDYSGIINRTRDAIGEGILSCYIVALAEKLSEHRRIVYHYTFDYARSKVGYKKWLGVPHMEEIYFVFGLPFVFPENYTPEEEEFSKQIIHLWTSFAKTGKPSYPDQEEEWLPYDIKERNIMNLKLGNIRNYKEEFKEECQLWKEINGGS